MNEVKRIGLETIGLICVKMYDATVGGKVS
jgi:hypothetical protein